MMTTLSKMATFFIFSCLCFLVTVSRALEQVCSSCPGAIRSSSEVSHLCQSTHGAKVQGRCCVSREADSDAIIGLDLWNCSLEHLDPALHLTNATVVIDISQNPLHDLPCELFRGLTGLQYIALPITMNCPGGDDLWGQVDRNGSERICQYQRSQCNSTEELSLLCPENSVCAPDGPGYTQCVCVPGFHGYKCLREGTFPMLMFFGILASVTVTLSVLLWCTQRRKVKNQ
ncbi:all-trans retinoic acid-induced differentiation factor [Bombina bombina]|uniref:all-trans retinoic acid-induced differentiation factor n=1 Tax=Bombina bombina TaxID=8345 RepID=UPI00235A77CC|nr:all-trans retinoic acid-induced differentiation factor [Bombina bombina]